jgi:hypothetical protein
MEWEVNSKVTSEGVVLVIIRNTLKQWYKLQILLSSSTFRKSYLNQKNLIKYIAFFKQDHSITSTASKDLITNTVLSKLF